jgi:hypothetical protein
MLPVGRRIRNLMPDRIKVDVIYMIVEVCLITDNMIPEPILPHSTVLLLITNAQPVRK